MLLNFRFSFNLNGINLWVINAIFLLISCRCSFNKILLLLHIPKYLYYLTFGWPSISILSSHNMHIPTFSFVYQHIIVFHPSSKLHKYLWIDYFSPMRIISSAYMRYFTSLNSSINYMNPNIAILNRYRLIVLLVTSCWLFQPSSSLASW